MSVISPSVVWNGTRATLPNFLNKVGETNVGGNGVWVLSRFNVNISPKHFGALGDGVVGATTAGTFSASDDTASIRAAVNSGIKIDGGESIYGLSSQIFLPENVRLKINVLMLSDAGQFDATSVTAVYAANQMAFLGVNLNNVDLDIKAWLKPAIGLQRSASVLVLRNCKDPKVKGRAQFFQDPIAPIFGMDSCEGGDWDVLVRDVTTNLTSMTGIQITGMGVDYNRIQENNVSKNSTAWKINGWFKNILLGATARAKYTEQTDGLNVQTLGYSGGTFNVYAENVGEPVDLFGDNMVGHINVRNAYNYGLKLIHGASFNKISGTVSGTGGPAVVLGGSNVAGVKSVIYNDIEVTVSGVGSIANSLFAGNVACAETDGSSAIYQPFYNTVRITGDATGANYIARTPAGSQNRFICDALGWSVGYAVNLSTGLQTFQRTTGTFIHAANSGGTTTLNNGDTFPFNTIVRDRLTEYDSAGFRFRVPGDGRYRITAKARAISVPAAKYVDLRIVSTNNGTMSLGRIVNEGTTAFEESPTVTHEGDFLMGDIIRITFNTDAGAPISFTADSSFNSLIIEQM